MSPHPAISRYFFTGPIFKRVSALTMAGLLAASSFAPVSAQAPASGDAAAELPKIPAGDAQKVISRLSELMVEHEVQRTKQMQNIVQRIADAMQSEAAMVELYKECIEAERFTGQSDNMRKQFRNWEDQVKDSLKRPEFRDFLRAHLEYLALSLEYLAVQEKSPEQIIPKLVAYIDRFPQHPLPGRQDPAHNLVTEDLRQSIFVRNLNLTDQINRLEKQWEQCPSNLSGMEEKTVLPILRVKAKERLMEFWDRKIARESARASEAHLASQVNSFRNNRLPRLQWERAQDMLLVGEGQKAYKVMFDLISSNQGHADFPMWVSTLEGYLKASLPPPVAGGGPTPAPAAQAQATGTGS